MIKIWFSLLAFCLAHNLYAQGDIEGLLQTAIDSIYHDNPESIGILIHVESPNIDLSWSGTAGYSDVENHTELHVDDPVLIASSIKTYVAATILKLVEKDKISLNSPIQSVLTERTRSLLNGEGYDLSAIQVKHLMSHTSGVWNYANSDYLEFKKENPSYRWTRNEQLELMVDKGNPVGFPGEHYHYSDANYLLLTEIIEELYGAPFYEAMKVLLDYDKLEIRDTWFPTLESKPERTRPLAHQYYGQYGWDSYDLDVSWDLYGGGGIACTMKDMASFIQAYFNGEIIENDSVLNLIFTEIRTPETALDPYYLGLSQDNYHGMNSYGHGGFWGTVMMYYPAINASISVCVLERDKRSLRKNILDAVSKILRDYHEAQFDRDDKLRDYLRSIDDFSGTILIAKKDSIIADRAYGYASVEYRVKNNSNTKFNIASISKLITSVGVLQLIEEGKIDVNDKVGKYLPRYPNATVKDSVSIHHLLSHTSGIPPVYGNNYLKSDKLKYKRVKDFIPLFSGEPLAFRAGERYEYSGSNFVLLGRIIEEVTGMDYYDYIDKNIFRRAGMKNSLAIPIDSIITNKAHGYTSKWGEQNYHSRNDYYLSKASPASGYYSTTHDLLSFLKSILNGTLISHDSYLLLTDPKVKGYNTHLGYGIDVDQRYNENIIGHSGGAYGVRTEAMYFISSDYTVIVLSNRDDDGMSGASKIIDDLKVIIAGNMKIIK